MRGKIYYIIAAFLISYTLGAQAPHKINGINLMPPLHPVEEDCTLGMEALGIGWLSIVTYIAGYMDKPDLNYDNVPRRWGDTPKGVAAMIHQAKAKGLKVMVKPSIWIPGFGWPGEVDFSREAQWKEWEENYRTYIMEYVHIAEAGSVEMFCIGTEIKQSVLKRPEFWRKLIAEIRENFSGQLTYSANWDNYYNIDFWDLLDYIGIDAYFPLVESKTPKLTALHKAWRVPKKQIQVFQSTWQKPVLFTEFGYRSIDQACWEQWEFEGLRESEATTNLEAQQNGYQALFENFWAEDWFAGGFIWHWLYQFDEQYQPNNNQYTPKAKPAASEIFFYYKIEGSY